MGKVISLPLSDVNALTYELSDLSVVIHRLFQYALPVVLIGKIDGPALRATALISYANWLMANSNTSFVASTMWPVIQLDLDYLANLWNQSTYVESFSLDFRSED